MRRRERPAAAGQGLEAPDGGLVHDLETRAAALVAFGFKLLEAAPVLIGQGYDQLSRLAVRDAELPGQTIDHPQAGDVGPGLERSGRGVEPGVDDAAVALADALGQVGISLEEEKPQFVARELPEDGAADDPAADAGDGANRALLGGSAL